jgi:hypothetical protein
MDAATDAGSIGTLNRMVAGSVSARLVENAVAKAAWVRGRMGCGTVAVAVGVVLALLPM